MAPMITRNGGTQRTQASPVFSTSALPVASDSITASYVGDPNFLSSASAALAQTVARDSTTTVVTSSANPSAAGQSVTFTATVSAMAPGSGTPTGSVNFYDGATLLGTATLGATGAATFATSTLTAASHSITATYAGDPNFIAGTSPTLTQAVTNNSTTTSLISSANPSVAGQSLTFTATVSIVAGGSGTLTGQVEFLDGVTLLGTSAVNGKGNAALTTSSLAVASHSVTAVYVNDANFTGSTSAALVQVVNRDATTTSVTSSAVGRRARPSTFTRPFRPSPRIRHAHRERYVRGWLHDSWNGRFKRFRQSDFHRVGAVKWLAQLRQFMWMTSTSREARRPR